MTAPLDRQNLLTRAAAWMQARGWKEKLAKRRGHTQRLLDHSRILARNAL